MKKHYRLTVQGVIFAILLIANMSIHINAQIPKGNPEIINYNYQDYGAHNESWWVLEGNNGLMYFANGSGVLEYDGETWRLIRTDRNFGARTLAKDDSDRIYVGGFSEFGYLEPNPTGQMEFISLNDKIPEIHREFVDVWEVDTHRGKVYFRTTNKIYIWDGDKIDVLVEENGFHVGGVVNDIYYVRIWNKGLCYLDNMEFKLVPGGERFSSDRIYVFLPYDENRMLLGIRGKGFLLFDGQNYEPFQTEIDDLVLDGLYLSGHALDDNRFVINTMTNGAFLIDHDGKFIQEYSISRGLSDNVVTHVTVDSRGLLWMTMATGIAYADIHSPYTFYGKNMGIEDKQIYDILRSDDGVYATTQNGFYYLPEGGSQFSRVENVFGQAGNLSEINGHTYAGTGLMGFMEIENGVAEIIRPSVDYNYRARLSRVSRFDTNRLFVAFEGGVSSYYYNVLTGKLELESDLEMDINSFEERPDGKLWMVSLNKVGEITVIDAPIDDNRMLLKDATITYMDSTDGLPHEQIYLGEFFGEMWISTNDGSEYVYNDSTRRWEEDKSPIYEYSDPQTTSNILRFEYDEEGRAWFDYGKGLTLISKNSDDNFTINTESFRDLTNKRLSSKHIKLTDEGAEVWFGSVDGAIRYQGSLDENKQETIPLIFQGIEIGEDSLLYAGIKQFDKKIELPVKGNTIRFHYTAPVFSNQKEITYTTMLEGHDDTWSTESNISRKEYNNLSPGDYIFKVKASNLYGTESEIRAIPFKILTPWYQSWWAYLLYGLGLISIIYFIIRQRTRLLEDRQKELEISVAERTKEVEKRMEELATINHVTKAITEQLDMSELIQLVGDEMKNLFNSDITYLALLDEETQIINFVYQVGDNMEPLRYGEGLTSKIIRTGEPLLINKDIDIEAEYDRLGEQQTGKSAISYLGVPIPSEGKIIGVLSVQSTQQESRFNDKDMRLLNTIARNVGVAIHNAELYEEAQQSKKQAEDANEAKSAFLSTVSHELRTPLTSVLGFAKIIKKRLEEKIFPAIHNPDKKIQRGMHQISENLNVVVSEGQRLTTLINDVLDLAKIESGKMDWNMQPIFLQDVLSRAIASTHSLIQDKKIEIRKKVPSDLPLITADEDKIIQVAINLLSNAVKFTEEGVVTISADHKDDEIIVAVRDTGIGIAEEDKHKVFERFRQAGDTLTDKPKGTGLGLPICREIIEHHGGRIWMESFLGKGSTFYFALPASMGHDIGQPMQLDRILNSLKKQIKHSAKVRNIENVPTILVVDDATPIRSLLNQELTEAGYQVKEAANGKAALDMVRLSKPDLIILDVMMPEINGFDVAAVLKNDPATMDIPIIILSIVQDKERGFRIGVDRYLTKPINTEELFHDVDELLEQGVSKKKVLVVDEDVSAVKSLTEVLSARGYKVVESKADQLVESAVENQPDIIMLKSVYNGDKEKINNLRLTKGMENVMFFIYE